MTKTTHSYKITLAHLILEQSTLQNGSNIFFKKLLLCKFIKLKHIFLAYVGNNQKNTPVPCLNLLQKRQAGRLTEDEFFDTPAVRGGTSLGSGLKARA